MSNDKDLGGEVGAQTEFRRRKREKALIIFLAALFIILSWIEFQLFGMSESLPFQHSIFFFGLVNFNIILFLLLMFLIFRNIVKNFAEREGGPIGSSLKSKLIAAFVGFSFVPTVIMFTVSVFYINNSFDRWFSEKTSNVLKSSIEVTNSYYQAAKRRNYHFAGLIAAEVPQSASKKSIEKLLENLRSQYSLDSVEYYDDILADPVQVYSSSEAVPRPPVVSVEFLKKAIVEGNDASTIHHFAGGDLIRVVVPVKRPTGTGAVVVSSYVALSLISKMDDIAAAYENYKDSDPLAYPVKSIYLIILVLMALVILLGATWFGVYLARQLSVPLERLGQATQRVVKGEYQLVESFSGSPEINRLIQNFNTMTQYLGASEKELTEANSSLRKTLSQLDEYSRYIEVVLTHITTGVISIDQNDMVTMINRHAARLLEIPAEKYIGKPVQLLLRSRYYRMFSEIMVQMKAHKAENIEKEIQVELPRKTLLLRLTVSVLYDEAQRELGKVLVFDDVSVIRSAQRAAAWTEVARRMAHEIKNPLTPISLAAQRLQRKYGASIQDPVFKECTGMIVDQVNGLKNLVNEFSQFARLPKIQPQVGDLNRAVGEAVQLFIQSDSSVNVSFSEDPSLPRFLFDPDQIKRAVTNIVDNAVESVTGVAGAAVSVRVTHNPTLKLATVTIEDNGRGIPAELRDRLFEPYVTTKSHGTGLGLAIVKRTIEDHDGYVRAFVKPEGGSRFVIELPLNMANT